VHEKMSKVAKKQQQGPEALEKFLQRHPVPVVLGPGQKRYLIDHHHLCCALHMMGVESCYAGTYIISVFGFTVSQQLTASAVPADMCAFAGNHGLRQLHEICYLRPCSARNELIMTCCTT
jgi:hypothetical protein